MLPSCSVEILEYLDQRGRSPYARWFDHLGAEAAAKVAVALTRLAQGNFSGMKSLGRGLHELRIHFGPGFRIYLGKEGERLVILRGGGTKKR
jgi:putative addiction module killer protein